MHVHVPSAAFRTGALLELGRCARHDAPASRARSRRFTTELPGIVLFLALFSFFLVLLVAAAFQKDLRGPIPECDRCAAIYRRRITVMGIGVVGSLALAVTAAFSRTGTVLLAGVVLLVVGIVAGVLADLARVRGTLDSGLGWVELRGVDPAFAAAVSARVQRAPELDPWVTPPV